MPANRLPARATLSATFSAAALVLAVSAQQAAASDLFFDDIPIVLTASRMAQSPLDAPVAVTVIDREMIEASGFTELHDLLRLVPGFLVADWAEGSPTVANHGLGDAYERRIKVMIDGGTVNSPLLGNTNWQELPVRVDDVERIEVVRGPNGAAYGVNAFQGVINIITRSPSTQRGASLISRVGKNGFYDHGFRVSGKAQEVVDWRISASNRRAVNFEPYLLTEANGDRVWNDRETITRSVFNLSATAQVAARDEISMMLGLSDGESDRGIPQSVSDPLREDDSGALFLHLGWKRSFTADSELSIHYYHQDERIRGAWLDASDSSALVVRDRNSDVRRDSIELQYAARVSPAWRFLVGAGLSQESVRAPYMFNTRETLRGRNGQLFGSVVWTPVERLQIDMGGLLEDHHYSGTLFSPRLAANYALTDESALRVSAGVSYRAPSWVESKSEEAIYSGGKIVRIFNKASPSLAPERVRHFELGYVTAFRELGLSLDLRGFHNSYSRYIDDESCRNPCAVIGEIGAPAGSKTFLFQNAGTFRMTGGEFSADWRRPGWGRVVLSQAFIDIDANEDVLDDDFEDSGPSSVTSLLLIKDLPDRWRASLGVYRHAVMNWLNDGDTVPGKPRFDFKLARSFGPPAAGNEVAIVAQSMGGRYVDFHEGRFRHEPQLFASLRLSW